MKRINLDYLPVKYIFDYRSIDIHLDIPRGPMMIRTLTFFFYKLYYINIDLKSLHLYSMFEYHRFILSSLCPYSCSLVDFAFRIGGILDPEFLVRCQVIDKNIEKLINELKQISINIIEF